MTTLNPRITVAALAALVIAVSLAVVLIGPPARATTPAAAYGSAAVRATNAVRRAHDRHTLRSDRCLHHYAAVQARRMAAQHRMFHQDLSVPLRRCHLHSIGENVAVGYRTGGAAVRQGWMKSAPHRANILHRPFRVIAVVARKGGGRWYASQLLARR